MRTLPFLTLALLAPGVALATNVTGTLPSDTSWDLAGSPYNLIGDVTVPASVTLTIQAGVQIIAATADLQGSGADTARVELIIQGTVLSQGTSASPVALTTSGASGAWYGTRVLAGGTANLAFTNVSKAIRGVSVEASTANLTWSGGGASNCSYGLYVSSGTANVDHLVLTANSSGAYYTSSGAGTFHHNTAVNNTNYGLYTSTTGVLTARDSIFTGNSYGIYYNSGTSPSLSYNDSWGNSTGNYFGVSAGTGSFSSNPLFVSASDFNLTSLSPARLSASDGSDLGALTYGGAVTPGLQGTLHVNTTLTGANTLAGDLTVPAGITLTLAPGATLTAGTNDGMQSGADTARVELIIQGTVLSQGTSASPVALTTSGASGAWYGTRVLAGGTANLAFTNVSKAIRGVSVEASTANLTWSGGGASNCSYGLYVSSGTANVDHLVLTANSSGAYYTSSGAGTFHHNTAVNNTNYGLYTSTTGVLTARDSIFTGNSYGIYYNSGTSPSLSYNDSWGNSTGNYFGVSAGTGSFSSNPLFVSASDFHLQATSPCRNAGSDGSDIGAYPYISTVDHIVIAPSNPSVTAGGTQAFTAQAYDASNNPIAVMFTWSALPAAGTINASGVLSASCGAGTVVGGVTATAPNGVSASTTITIIPGAVTQITLSPASATIAAGGSQTFTATPRDSCGNAVSTPVTWSTAPGAGSITSQGVYTAPCAPGSYPTAVTATVGSISASANVTVTLGPVADILLSPPLANVPAGGMQAFTAIPLDSCANPLPTTVVWSAAPGAGSIDASGNYIAPCAPGSYAAAVRATAGSVTRTADVVVGTGALAQILVSPASATVSAGGAQAFTATPKDSCGNTVSAPITWSTTPGAGSITSVGAYTAPCTPGNYASAVRASSGAVTGTASVTVTPGALASLSITPANPSVPVGTTQAFSAAGTDSCGNSVSPTVSWSVVAGGGTISAAGVFTAGGTPGTFANTIQATSGAITAHTGVTVVPGAIHHITVTPASPTVPAGGSVAFSAQAYDSADNPITGVTFTWSALPAAGTISPTGVLTASCSPGTISNAVTASAEGVSVSTSVTLTAGALARIDVSPDPATVAAGASRVFTATPRDSCGNTITAPITWSVAAGAGLIDSSGNYTAPCTPGSHAGAVIATSGTTTGSADVTVTTGALAQVTIQPSDPTLPAGGSQTFTASTTDSCGNAVGGSVTWSVAAGGGTIDPATGVFTAGSVPGTFTGTVRASAGGQAASTSVTITAGSVATVAIVPTTATLTPGAKATFTATAQDAFGNPVATAATWSVINGGGTIDAGTGELTAGSVAGTFNDTVLATVSDKSATATVVVVPGPASRVAVSPASATVAPGGTTSFSAQVFDAFDNPRGDTVTWSVGDPLAGSISSSGVLTAGTVAGSYPGAIVASAGSASGTASVTIQAGALARLELSPATATVQARGTVTFTVKGLDAYGNTVPVTPTWSVLHGGGTVDAQGVFTAGNRVGTFTDTLQVQAGGLAATATVVVLPGGLASMVLSPDHPTLAPGQTQQFTAPGKDPDGNEVSGLAFTWSADPAAGTIDSNGLFTAGSTPGEHLDAVRVTVGEVTATTSVLITASEADGGTDNPPPGGGCGCSGGGNALTVALGLLALVVLSRRERARLRSPSRQ